MISTPTMLLTLVANVASYTGIVKVFKAFKTCENETNNAKMMYDIYRLRYDTFCKRLKWIPGNPQSGLEMDHWDERATHFAVYFRNKPVAYARALVGGYSDIMIGHDFKPLLPNGSHHMNPMFSFEITRLCVADHIKSRWLKMCIIGLLYIIIRAWASSNSLNRLWAVLSRRTGDFLQPICGRIGYTNFTEVASGKMPGDDNEYLVIFADVK